MSITEVPTAILGGLIQSKNGIGFKNEIVMSCLGSAIEANGGRLVNPSAIDILGTQKLRTLGGEELETRQSGRLIRASECAVVELSRRANRAQAEAKRYIETINKPLLVLTNRYIFKGLIPPELEKSDKVWQAAYGDYNDMYRAISVFLEFARVQGNEVGLRLFRKTYWFLEGNDLIKTRKINVDHPSLKRLQVPRPTLLVQSMNITPADVLGSETLETAVFSRSFMAEIATGAVYPTPIPQRNGWNSGSSAPIPDDEIAELARRNVNDAIMQGVAKSENFVAESKKPRGRVKLKETRLNIPDISPANPESLPSGSSRNNQIKRSKRVTMRGKHQASQQEIGDTKRLSHWEEEVLKIIKSARGAFVSAKYISLVLWDSEQEAQKVRMIIREIREKLGDDAKNPIFIGSLKKSGYCWLGKIDDKPDKEVTMLTRTDADAPVFEPVSASLNTEPIPTPSPLLEVEKEELAAPETIVQIPEPIVYRDLIIDPVQRAVFREDERVEALTGKNVLLFYRLAQSKGQPVTALELGRLVSPFYIDYPTDRADLLARIKKMRAVLEKEPKKPEILKAVPSVGYILVDDSEPKQKDEV